MATLVVGCVSMILYACIPSLHVIGQPVYLVAPASIAALLVTLVVDKRKIEVASLAEQGSSTPPN